LEWRDFLRHMQEKNRCGLSSGQSQADGDGVGASQDGFDLVITHITETRDSGEIETACKVVITCGEIGVLQDSEMNSLKCSS
jgi:hypothetical protein